MAFCLSDILFDDVFAVLANLLNVYSTIYMWGVGDTAAALIGKRFGRHQVRLPLADSRKTWEGSAAMMVTAFCAGFLSLLFISPMKWYCCLAYACIAALVAAYVELISHGGNDTVSVPTAVSLVLALMMIP